MTKLLNTFYIFFQYLLPKHFVSRLVAKIAAIRLPVIKNFIITQYAKFYCIDMAEALEPNLSNYSTFNDFFTRALKPNARPITADPRVIISPVDGKILQFGTFNAEKMIYAKGKNFTLEQLLAADEDAAKFQGAEFAVLYLAPYNYHRIHMPLRGKLLTMRYIPGTLFSVNPDVVARIPDVFARNERVVAIFDTAIGVVAVILVGATIVGGIETAWAGAITPSMEKKINSWDYKNENIVFERGIEIGRFQLGSTVILLLPPKTTKWCEVLQEGVKIKMGWELGKIL